MSVDRSAKSLDRLRRMFQKLNSDAGLLGIEFADLTNLPTTVAGYGITDAVTSVVITTANGVSGVTAGTQALGITITLGAITPSSVAASGTVTGSNLSGTNTGNQTAGAGLSGTTTLSVVHDPMGRRVFGANPNPSAVTWLTHGMTITSSVAATTANDADGPWKQMTATGGQLREWFTLLNSQMQWLPDVIVRLKTDTALPTDFAIGFTDGLGSTTYQFDNSDTIAVGCRTTHGDTAGKWHLIHNNAGNTNATVVNSNLTLAPSTVYWVRIRWDSTTSVSGYYSTDGVNWTLIGTATTNLPDTTATAINYFVGITEASGATIKHRVNRFYGSFSL